TDFQSVLFFALHTTRRSREGEAKRTDYKSVPRQTPCNIPSPHCLPAPRPGGYNEHFTPRRPASISRHGETLAMSMTVPLPPALRERLTSVASRVRLLRGLRGLSVLLIVLALTAAAAVAVDWYLGGRLPVLIRAVNLTAWSAVALALA